MDLPSPPPIDRSCCLDDVNLIYGLPQEIDENLMAHIRSLMNVQGSPTRTTTGTAEEEKLRVICCKNILF